MVTQYSALVPLIIAYRTTPSADTKVNLDAAIDLLDAGLKKITNGLSKIPHSNLVMKELHAERLLGFLAEPLATVVYDDLFTAHERIQQIATDTQTLKTTAINILANLKNLNYEIDSELNNNLFSIEFLGGTEIHTLSELETFSKKIRVILYSYACLSEDKAESVPMIQSISKGSPVTIDVTWIVDNLTTILGLIGMTIIFYLKKKEDLIRTVELEQLIIRSVPKMNTKMKQGFAQLKDGVLSDKVIEQHVGDLIKASKNKSKDRAAGEQQSLLLKGAKELIQLLEDGARVEVYAPGSDDGENSATGVANETTLIYTKYRQIEQKTSLIEANVSIKIPKNTKSTNPE